MRLPLFIKCLLYGRLWFAYCYADRNDTDEAWRRAKWEVGSLDWSWENPRNLLP